LVSKESLCDKSLIVTLEISATVFEILTLKARQESCAIAKDDRAMRAIEV